MQSLQKDINRIYIGIDGGLHGAISVINEREEVLGLFPMPIVKKEKTEFDISGLQEALISAFGLGSNCRVYIFLEKAHARPISGCKQSFITGFGYGLIQALLTAEGWGFELIEPKRWQKELFKGLNVDDTKQASIMYCKRKYPTTAFEMHGKAFVDGLTDATCIAIYGKRMLGGKQDE